MRDGAAYLGTEHRGGGGRLHVEYVDLVYRALHDLLRCGTSCSGRARSLQSGVALRVELDPLIRRVARKCLIRTAAMRRRVRLILAVAGHHFGCSYEGVDTTGEWSSVLRDGRGQGAAPVSAPRALHPEVASGAA